VQNKTWEVMKIKRRFPNYFSGFPETEHEVSNYEEFVNIDWIKNATEMSGHHVLAYSKSNSADRPHLLMTFSGYDEKYGGCKNWFVIGYLFGDPSEIGLKSGDDLFGHHLSGCPQDKWQHNECTCGFKN
jgi:hypothetical protein